MTLVRTITREGKSIPDAILNKALSVFEDNEQVGIMEVWDVKTKQVKYLLYVNHGAEHNFIIPFAEIIAQNELKSFNVPKGADFVPMEPSIFDFESDTVIMRLS